MIPLFFLCVPPAALAKFTINAENIIDITLTGFSGLEEVVLFQGKIAKDSLCLIDISYRGLVLLDFTGGQSYPLVIGDLNQRGDRRTKDC